MRFLAGLLAYLVGISAVISIGIVGLMALQSPIEPTPSAPIVAATQKGRPVKPAKQVTVDDKKAQPGQKHKVVQVTGKKARPNPKHNMVQDTKTHEAPSTVAGHNAYGYVEEPRRIDPNLFPFFGR
jgi:hypothetical protein